MPPRRIAKPARTVSSSSRFMTSCAISKILGVTRNTVNKMFDSGLLKGWKLPNGDRRISTDSLAAFMESQGLKFRTADALIMTTDVDLIQALTLPDNVFVSSYFELGYRMANLSPSVIVIDSGVSPELSAVVELIRGISKVKLALIVGEGSDATDLGFDKLFVEPLYGEKILDWIQESIN